MIDQDTHFEISFALPIHFKVGQTWSSWPAMSKTLTSSTLTGRLIAASSRQAPEIAAAARRCPHLNALYSASECVRLVAKLRRAWSVRPSSESSLGTLRGGAAESHKLQPNRSNPAPKHLPPVLCLHSRLQKTSRRECRTCVRNPPNPLRAA